MVLLPPRLGFWQMNATDGPGCLLPKLFSSIDAILPLILDEFHVPCFWVCSVISPLRHVDEFVKTCWFVT
jgi:hypothetical protein